LNGLEWHEPERVNLAEVNPAPYNPRTITEPELDSLKASMMEHGVVLNLVVQREADDGRPLVLIGGHQRVRAARELCASQGWDLPEFPWATVLDVNDRKAKRLNARIAQARIAAAEPLAKGPLGGS